MTVSDAKLVAQPGAITAPPQPHIRALPPSLGYPVSPTTVGA